MGLLLRMKWKSTLACLLLLRTAHGYIYPVMQCSNEKALPFDCETEVQGAINAMIPWFHPYILHEDKHDGDRKLLECHRFCQERAYFFFHAPCDCSRRRLMKIPNEHRTLEEAEDNPLEGPLQLLEKHVSTLPSGHCKDVLSQSNCFLSFVEEYDKTVEYDAPASSTGGMVEGLDKLLSIPGLELIEAEEYDPVSHQATLIDVSTGEKTPIDVDFDPEDTTPSTHHEIDGLTVIDQEKYDPSTGTTTIVDPTDPSNVLPGQNDPRGEDPTDVVNDPNRIENGHGLDGAHKDPEDIGNTPP